MRAAHRGGSQLLVVPELAITGYTCADLFAQRPLLDAASESLLRIAEESAQLPGMLTFVGAPLCHKGALYNCAVAINNGRILGVVPKTYLPNYNEFYEKRWFASAATLKPGCQIEICGASHPFGTDLIFRHGDATVAAEICEDLWTVNPPGVRAAIEGANVIVNLSATNEVIGKHDYLTSLISQQSGRCHAAYVYASAGFGESSTDLVYAGNAIIAENGHILRHSPRFQATALQESADIDLELLDHDRQIGGSMADAQAYAFRDELTYRTVAAETSTELESACTSLLRTVNPYPFVPSEHNERYSRCGEIIEIQTHGLMQRLSATGCKTLVVGISGGLDSTLALLIAANAFDKLHLDRKGIKGVTMPGFGTTGRTYRNAITLMEQLGVSILEINIAKAVRQHFLDIDHDEAIQDVTYENSQARERTQILMDLANKYCGMVLGTGDLSELALGWATYNGDHMSMYGVNTSVPKTLVKYLVSYFASVAKEEKLRAALLDIIDTPISPELIPADEKGNIKQKTEDLVGPYPLHDFFLYNMLRHGFSPRKIYKLACIGFKDEFDAATISHWLKTFYRRFFAQQFKRSCLPDGPKIGSICLSPRGDWRMPSDVKSTLWLKEIEEL